MNTTKITKGVCVLHLNPSKITGTITFSETTRGLRISYHVLGLTDGKHGFHIHQYGDLTEQCISACAHFNPTKQHHGGRNDTIRHLGDLGNIDSKDGVSHGFFF